VNFGIHPEGYPLGLLQFVSPVIIYSSGTPGIGEVQYSNDINVVRNINMSDFSLTESFPYIMCSNSLPSQSRLMWNRTGSRDINLPDKSGMIALLSDINGSGSGNLDGGFANSTYTSDQNTDGGHAV
jgi:hypothetical protein